MLIAAGIPSNPLAALLVLVILFGIGRLVCTRVAYAEGNPWLLKVLMISLVLHLLAAPGQIYVVDHFYHGIADWNRYVHQGALLSSDFRHFNFTTANANVRQIVNDGSVSIAAGIVMAIVGANELATFFVFGFLSFLGCICFYRAFTLTFAGANHRRYALMLFLMPSLIFWTADTSKESLMMLALGLISFGGAKFLARKRGGFILVAPGVFIGAYVRPNELLLVLAGFVVAMMIPTAAARRSGFGIKRLISLVFLGALLYISVAVTVKYLHHGLNTSSLQTTNAQNGATGNSGGVPYSSNFAYYPRDVYEVLFNPLPFNSHGFGERVAALENTVILVLILASLRNLRILPRAAFARPYVMMCLVYTATFIYSFAALGNLGLIERERTMMIPFLFVLLSIPRGPKRAPPRYEWEIRRRVRLAIRQAAEHQNAIRALHRAPPEPSGPGRPGG
jgi:hypothetical protein